MNERHALLFIGLGRAMHIGLAPEENAPLIWCVDPRKALDQGRFSGAIFPQQGQHLARIKMQAHIAQSGGAAKALRHVLETEQTLGQPFLPWAETFAASLKCYR